MFSTVPCHWRQSTADQRSEYLRLFEDFIVQAYARRFKDYAGETFVVDRSWVAGSGIFYVQSRIVRASQPPIRVDWRVRREDGGFRVVDVLVEGISMLITHRQEFASVIQNADGRLEGLLAALRKKTAEK